MKKDAKLPLDGAVIDLGQLFEDIELYVGDTLVVSRDYRIWVERFGKPVQTAMLKDIAVRARVIKRPKKNDADEMEIEEPMELE